MSPRIIPCIFSMKALKASTIAWMDWKGVRISVSRRRVRSASPDAMFLTVFCTSPSGLNRLVIA